MYYHCVLQAPDDRRAQALARAAKRITRKSRNLTIDIHCHFMSPRAIEFSRPHGGIAAESAMRYATDLTRKLLVEQNARVMDAISGTEKRLAEMDRMGVDIQAVSPGPQAYGYYLPPEIGRQASAMVNDDLAALVARHPDRLVAMGTVPAQNTEFAIAEMERCVRDHDMRGIEISSHVNGKELAKELEPFFARAEELGVLIFLHPLGTTSAERLAEHYFNNVIANPLEATISVGYLIMDGVLERHPKLKMCVAHGGGYISHYIGRSDHTFRAREDGRVHIKKKPSDYLKRLYFDTVVFDHDQLRHLVARWGADHVIMGTDWPYDMAEPDPVWFVESCKGLTALEKAQIHGLNAAKLLGLRAKKPAPKKAPTKTRARRRR
jgi:aminocarboxymuconate-semialdehyde decarboxylase